jgi:uncharacterized membrane protein
MPTPPIYKLQSTPSDVAHAAGRQHRDRLLLAAALVGSSALSVALFALRASYSGSATFVFLNWNLFLAWLPLLFALAAWTLQNGAERPRLRVLPLLALWLLFFPNAPYLLTDLIHLRERAAVPIWYDLSLLLSYAWNGLILGYLSLRLVQGLLQHWFGPTVAWAGAAAALFLGAFGIYLGRFERWNSWDVFTNPQALAASLWGGLANPLTQIKPLAITLLLCALLAAIYVTVGLLGRADPVQGARESRPPGQSQ